MTFKLILFPVVKLNKKNSFVIKRVFSFSNPSLCRYASTKLALISSYQDSLENLIFTPYNFSLRNDIELPYIH